MTRVGPFSGTLQDAAGNRIVIGPEGAELVLADAPDPVTPPVVAPPVVGPPRTTRSGLPWDSGVWANDKTMPARWEAMRGRKIDVADVHCEPQDVGNPWWLYGYRPDTVGSLTLSCALTETQPPAAFAAAGKAMAGRGFKGPLARLRPGVELNLRNASSVTDATVDAWADRFRAAANSFRQGAGPGARVCLCVNEGEGAGLISRAGLDRLVDELLRDGSADELGIDFYDQWNPMLTSAEFARRVDPGRWGSLGFWADFASSRGRRVSVPEWGVARTDGGQWAGHAGGDNPAFVTSMIGWFREHADRIGYESYFPDPDDYIRSDLTSMNPRARAAYVAGLR